MTPAPGVFAHWPNRITALRFVGAAVLFGLLQLVGERTPQETTGTLQICFWLFIAVALTDLLDGYLARRWGLETAFGRIADPFVDKVLVLGTMIYLAAMEWSQPWFPAWIVVVVLARELLVTGVRGYVESLGHKFPADWFGKIKMGVQCFAIGTVMGLFAFRWNEALHGPLSTLAHALVWITLVASVGSGLSYVFKARQFLLGASS